MAWGKWVGTALVALLVWRAIRVRWLRPSGAIALALSLVASCWFGGWPWELAMLAYWLSAMLLSRYRSITKQPFGERFSSSPRLGWVSVIARTGWPVVLVLLDWLEPGRVFLYAGYIGALATAAADTWSTDLGILNLQSPKLITDGRRVPPGTAGATSPLGLIASVAGAWLVGMVGLVAQALASARSTQVIWDRAFIWLPLSAALGGLVGSLLDSFFGATAQGLYYCDHCEIYSEERLHSCGREAHQVRGWAWLTNDGVNLVSSLVGAAVSAVLVTWLARSIL